MDVPSFFQISVRQPDGLGPANHALEDLRWYTRAFLEIYADASLRGHRLLESGPH
jgi:hypothetical protein